MPPSVSIAPSTSAVTCCGAVMSPATANTRLPAGVAARIKGGMG